MIPRLRAVKKTAAALQERMEAYRAAASDPASGLLAARLASDLEIDGGKAEHLAAYIRRAADDLDRTPWRSLASGRLQLPSFDMRGAP